ncbi:helix-turn-helix domain-containing protein [Rossellomorea aquimaris]|uniref:helix-turn-helix domain-containing protein n=1 Tax=Rossellomorea aquimaris TaxID=189382 RepID=UPI001CFDFD46|nr:helix-turn-helix domain-containing protein [Rossellomorea aquimaris]
MQYLSEYQSFPSVSSLNEALYRHTCDHYYEMSDTDRNVLKLIGRFAVKYRGAAHLKASTIAQAIGKSEKTARRSLGKLQALGILVKVSTMRKVAGGYGANIYLVQSPVSSRAEGEKPMESTPEPEKMESEAITLSSEKELLSNNTSCSPYIRFKRLIADKKVRNKIYGIWLAHTSYLKNAFDHDVLLNVGITAAMTAFKSTGVRNIVGYYNGVLDRMLDRLYFAEVYSDIS